MLGEWGGSALIEHVYSCQTSLCSPQHMEAMACGCGNPLKKLFIGPLAINSHAGGFYDRFESNHGAIEYCTRGRLSHWRSRRVMDAFGHRGSAVEWAPP